MNKIKFYEILVIIFAILTLFGSAAVFVSGGQISAGYSVIPLSGYLSFLILLQKNPKKSKLFEYLKQPEKTYKWATIISSTFLFINAFGIWVNPLIEIKSKDVIILVLLLAITLLFHFLARKHAKKHHDKKIVKAKHKKSTKSKKSQSTKNTKKVKKNDKK